MKAVRKMVRTIIVKYFNTIYIFVIETNCARSSEPFPFLNHVICVGIYMYRYIYRKRERKSKLKTNAD